MGASQGSACGCCKEELSVERRADMERRDRPIDPTADEVAVEPVLPAKDPKAIGRLPLPAARLPIDAKGGGAVGARKLELSESEDKRAGAKRPSEVPSSGVERKPSKDKDAQKSGKLTAAQLIARAAAHVKTGDEAFAKSEWDAAVDAYTEALALNASLSGAWAGRGGANLRKGALGEALADLNEALRLEEDSLLALRDRAEVRYKTGDLDGAVEDFNRKLSMAPGDGRALCGRGEARLKKGDRNGAISDFQLAMQLSYPGAKEMYNAAKGGS